VRVELVKARNAELVEKEKREMSQYLILIFQDPETTAQLTGQEVSAGFQTFMADHEASLRGGSALERAAVTVRRDEAGEARVTDGPFAESKEVLGGYFLIEAADLDAAAEIAKDMPAAAGLEIRPVRVSR
jgi:hypothetical protein